MESCRAAARSPQFSGEATQSRRAVRAAPGAGPRREEARPAAAGRSAVGGPVCYRCVWICLSPARHAARSGSPEKRPSRPRLLTHTLCPWTTRLGADDKQRLHDAQPGGWWGAVGASMAMARVHLRRAPGRAQGGGFTRLRSRRRRSRRRRSRRRRAIHPRPAHRSPAPSRRRRRAPRREPALPSRPRAAARPA